MRLQGVLSFGLGAVLLGWTAGGAAAADLPLLSYAGVHLLELQGGAPRWLGPGGDPAWTPDGTRLCLDSAHGPLTGPPLGPLFYLDADTRQAQGLCQDAPRGLAQPSLDGKWLAVLVAPVDDPLGWVQILEAEHGKPASRPIALGPLTARLRDAYAWSATGELIVAVNATNTLAPGIWAIQPASSQTRQVATGPGADGVWPSPDGGAVAVRVGGILSVVGTSPDWQPPLDAADVQTPTGEQVEPASATVALPWPETPGVAVGDVSWDSAGTSLWVEAVQKSGDWVYRRTVRGAEVMGWPLPRQAVSPLAFKGNRLWYWGAGERGPVIVEVDLSLGLHRLLAQADPAVPFGPGHDWPAPAPAVSPDGLRLAVSLSRSDRWGHTDPDVLKATDTDVAGNAVNVIRRLRSVGCSGLVFQPAALEFKGQGKPTADSPVVSDTRPGALRWQRPGPPHWIVLHHTATTSDSSSLRSLTTTAAHRIASRYDDVTPGVNLPGEPSTLSAQYLVLRDGRVVQLVEEAYLARHAGTGQWLNQGPIYDFNAETIGIEIVANGNDFTPAQVTSVGKLVADIGWRRGIPLLRLNQRSFASGVLYHRDFAAGLRGKPDPAGWPWDEMLKAALAWNAARATGGDGDAVR